VNVIERECPDGQTRALFKLTMELADAELRPRVDAAERDGAFPREAFRALGRSGLLALPYPRRLGGGGYPYQAYLQVVEELARAWLAVGLGVSVHTLTCYPLATAGTPEQQERWLPAMLGGELLGAYCLSEPTSGSEADFYTVFARSSGDHQGPGRAQGISCLHVPAQTPGVSAAPAEHKMGMRASVTAQMVFDGARVPASHLIGGEGRGFAIALAALDGGRLGIAACATGVAQAALDTAVSWASQRRQSGARPADSQGVSFLLADMATAVEAARALYLSAARRKDAGLPYGQQAAMAKLFASDAAMRVATDAVQVLGDDGYTEDLPAARLMREAKVLQIVEGTNQVQRIVIGRSLDRPT